MVRTNCLDCLDRTNSIQEKIGWRMLKTQLLQHSANTDIYFKNHPLQSQFTKLWLKNGNKISLQYAGTEAITKHKGFINAVNNKFKTVNRFIKSNFSDDSKQDCITFLLDRKTASTFS